VSNKISIVEMINMSKKENRINNIDILRGMAIIFVVLFHYTAYYSPNYLLRTDNWTLSLAKYGWSGVDIFFVVSGFCIAMTIIRTQNYFEFIIKRFARIYPAYFICGITTLIFYSLFDLPGREVDWITGLMNLVFANFIPGLNYQYIDGIYWALIVELKFYIFFGAIYFLIKNLGKAIIIWALISIMLNIILLIDDKLLVFLTSITPHSNFFLIGLMLFYSKDKNFYLLILISILTLLNIYTNNRYSENELYFIFLIFFTSIILMMKYKLKFKLLSNIGLVSFSWYLLHNAIGIIIIREINKLGFENFSVALAIIFTLSISVFSFTIIEKPLKKFLINIFFIIKNKKFISNH